ncbi:thiamine-binding protein [Vibrio sp. SS-MA-C1-2]|uniref:thiamine-binding protein n=1 Tax=Vibrio sp. SS-MA-C1-2 TaxID=2908646 RepID=UPI001F420A32|nr:thiamine-binding protein [Vibrio sp. SS-MA-C1-2]UJF18254.1 thiamine-binding protein [Vibrio sp. SS-MA-C1-2]
MSYSLSLKYITQKSEKYSAYDSVDQVLACIAKSGLTHTIGVSETTVTSDNFDLILQLLKEVESISRAESPTGFMLLANVTYASYEQDMVEKMQRVERFSGE